MADFGINPQIPLGVQGPKRTSIGDLLGTATKAMEYSRLSELYPALIKKAEAESQSAQLGVAEKELMGMGARLTAAINNPMVIQAEQDPNSVDQQKLIQYITTAGREHAKAMKLDPKRADELLAPIIRVATENPGMVRESLKEELRRGLDASARAQMMGGPGAIGVSTIPTNQPAFRGRGVTPEAMTAPLRGPVQGQNLMVAPVTENQVSISNIPGGAPTTAPAPMAAPMAAPVAAGQMVQPEVSNFPLMFEPPARAGIQRPKREGEDKAIEFGQTLRDQLAERQLNMTKAREDVANVIRSANDLINKGGFIPETGPGGQLRRGFASLTGDPTYQELEKNLANVISSNLAALKVGGNSVAGLELTKEAAGKLGYDPTVLLKIARRADADLTNIDMMATGLQKHSQRFGDANAQRFTKMWSDNADSKVFQIMNINRDIEDPKLKQDAAAEILKDMTPKQREILNQKYQRIVRLTNTGDIAQ